MTTEAAVVTWDDFQAVYQPLLDEFERSAVAWERAQRAWESVAATWQELIDYIHRWLEELTQRLNYKEGQEWKS